MCFIFIKILTLIYYLKFSLNDILMEYKIYHEKQKNYDCAIHTLNNLFQRMEFEESEIQEFVETLKRDFNVKAMIPYLGYYDINLIEYALHQRGCSTKWLKNSVYLIFNLGKN